MPLDQSYYINNLSIKSADPNIVSRNEGGNLIEVTDEFLYIEPITYQYINSNINNVLTTNFSYYKFPSRIIVVDEVDSESLSFDELDITDELNQPIKSRYKLNKQIVPKLLGKPEIAIKIKDGTINANKLELQSNTVITDNSQVAVSMTELQFDIILEGSPQLTTNRFTVTEDILSANKDIRFKIKIALKYTTDDRYNNYVARVIRINPDTAFPTTLEEQTSAVLVTPDSTIRTYFIQKEISEDSIYILQNSISKIQTSYDQTKQQLNAELELQNEKISNYVNGALGSNVLNKNNNDDIRSWDSIVEQRVQLLEPIKQQEILTTYKNLVQIRETQRDSKLVVINQQADQIRQLTNDLRNEQINLQTATRAIDSEINNLQLLYGEYGYLRGNNEPYVIGFDIVIPKSDLKLNDTYAVEFVNGPIAPDVTGGNEPVLLDDQTYWLIEEISDATIQEIEKDIQQKRNKIR